MNCFTIYCQQTCFHGTCLKNGKWSVEISGGLWGEKTKSVLVKEQIEDIMDFMLTGDKPSQYLCDIFAKFGVTFD